MILRTPPGALWAAGVGLISFALVACSAVLGFDTLTMGSSLPDAASSSPDATTDATTTDGADTQDAIGDAPVSCGDPLTNPQNCGACGHSCLGGDCDAGTCMPVTLANSGAASLIVVDDVGVYWTVPDNDGGVMRSNKDGGAQAFLVQHLKSPAAIAVHQGKVYFAASSTIGVVPTDGGGVSIAAGSLGTSDLAVDDAGLMATTVDVGHTGVTGYGLDLSSGLSTPNQGGQVDGIAIDANKVYFALQPGTIRAFDRATLAIQTDLPGQATPAGVAVDDNFVFWTNNGDGTVRRAATTLAASAPIASTQNNPHRLALDTKNVYWANGGGTIMRVDKQGVGGPVFLFSGPAGPYGIAVDTQAVYWTNPQNGTVMKLAKPLN